MNAAIFARELRLNLTLFLAWTGTIVGMTFVVLAMMPLILGSSEQLKGFFTSTPASFLKGFSMDLSTLFDPLAYYASYSMLYTVLLGGIFSASLTARCLHREQAERTGEYLLVRPVSRGAVFASKAAACFALVLGLNLLVFATAAAGFALFTPKGSTWSPGPLAAVSLYGLLFTLGMAGIGLLVSALARRARSLTGPAVGIVLFFYLVDMVSKITEKYGAVGWVSPFKWVDVGVTRAGYGVSWWRVALFAGLIVLTVAPAAAAWRRKDILA